MPRDGSGTYTLPEAPFASATIASSSVMNAQLSDIASALTGSVNAAGTKPMAANLAMGGFRLTGLGAGSAAGESLRYEQLGAAGLTFGALTDPGADRLVFWDDSETAYAFMTVGTGLAISTTTLALASGAAATNLGFTPLNPASNLSDLASASSARANLGLGTAATVNTGTSGATVPLLNGANTWAQIQTFSARPVFNGSVLIKGGSTISASGANGTLEGIIFENTNSTRVAQHWELMNTGTLRVVNTGYSVAFMSLDQSGNLSCNGTITGSSDATLKKNVRRIDDASDIVSRLRGVRFEWNDAENQGTNFGLIAQEVQAVAPEIVREGLNGKLAVAYGNVVALLVNDNNELRRRIEALEARL